jgi:hypothetical protein
MIGATLLHAAQVGMPGAWLSLLVAIAVEMA